MSKHRDKCHIQHLVKAENSILGMSFFIGYTLDTRSNQNHRLIAACDLHVTESTKQGLLQATLQTRVLYTTWDYGHSMSPLH